MMLMPPTARRAPHPGDSYRLGLAPRLSARKRTLSAAEADGRAVGGVVDDAVGWNCQASAEQS
jgi:hypothetical protein